MRATKSRSHIWKAVVAAVACVALLPTLAMAQQTRATESKPVFLVATPELTDPMFQRTVILMLPSALGPLVAGLVINKPTAVPLRKLFPDLAALKNQGQTVYFGGPVDIDQACLLIRASGPPKQTTQLFDHVYVNTDPSSFDKLLADPESAKSMRFFLGRVQWTHDQLHGEILAGAWYVMPAEAEQIFSADPGRIWSILVQRAHVREINTILGDGQPKAIAPLTRALPHWPL
jgi:putative transcriptional regulator